MKVAIIPARGGSKRIPRKNIKLFSGRPMLCWPIQTAFASQIFDLILVSTDDEEIKEIAISAGATVPFLRPPELSNDHATTADVMKHALDWLKHNIELPTHVCCIYATTPFLKPEFLRNAYQKLLETERSFCFSVSAFPSPVQRALRINDQQFLEPVWPENKLTRTQDLEDLYFDAGQFYWGKASAFMSNVSVHSSSSVPFILPREYAQDIDTLEDWKLAEYMFQAIHSESASYD